MSKEYIDREEVIKILEQYDLSSGSTLGCHSGAIECAISAIEMLPAADVTPVVHGRWIEDHDYLKCPECSVMVKWDFTFFDIGDWNYCPNCGAYMMGKNNGKCE
jgi:hypothetical protein